MTADMMLAESFKVGMIYRQTKNTLKKIFEKALKTLDISV